MVNELEWISLKEPIRLDTLFTYLQAYLPRTSPGLTFTYFCWLQESPFEVKFIQGLAWMPIRWKRRCLPRVLHFLLRLSYIVYVYSVKIIYQSLPAAAQLSPLKPFGSTLQRGYAQKAPTRRMVTIAPDATKARTFCSWLKCQEYGVTSKLTLLSWCVSSSTLM